jgi:hypothetical protein
MNMLLRKKVVNVFVLRFSCAFRKQLLRFSYKMIITKALLSRFSVPCRRMIKIAVEETSYWRRMYSTNINTENWTSMCMQAANCETKLGAGVRLGGKGVGMGN